MSSCHLSVWNVLDNERLAQHCGLENMLSETIFAMSTLDTNKSVVGSFRRQSSQWPELQEKAYVGRCKPTQEVKDK